MKKYLKHYLILLLAIINSNNIFAQGFNSISTPDGVNVIAAGDAGKIFRSSNAGNTWASYTVPSVNFKSVFSLNNDVWIAGDNGKIYKTLKTSSPVNSYDVGVSTSINSLYFINNNVGYLCGDAGAIYKTVNSGINWTISNTGVSNVKLNSISFTDAQKGIIVGNGGKVFITANGGASWIEESIGTTKNLLKVNYHTDGIVIVGEFGDLFLKPNASAWTSVDTRVSTDIRGVSGSGISNVHICGGGGFIRNNKNGNEAFLNFEMNPMMANLSDIFYYNSNVGFAVSSLNSAIIRTTNGGSSWELTAGTTRTMTWVSKLTANSGIGNNLSMHPTNRDAMFVVYGSTVYISRNRGESWSNIATVSGGGSAHSFYVSPLDTNIWMCAITGSPDRVTRSTNYGSTWTTIVSRGFSNYGQPLEMDQNNPSVYYFAPDGGGFLKSTDNGATFIEISNNYPFRSPCDIIVQWDNSNNVFVGDGVTGSGQAKIFKSTNGGVNWREVYTVTSSETPSLCNTAFEPNVIYSTEWSSSGFYKSTNAGENWSLAGLTGSSGWGSDVCREDPGMVLKGSYGSPTYLTTNAGINFQATSLGGGCGAGIIVPERGYLISMQCSGLYKMNITYSVITDINVNINTSVIPENYNLYQNYPNPFNPATNIKFDLPNSGNVSLKVYDQLGNEMNSLVNEFKAAGSYEVSFNASEFASGVYYYKLITSNGISIAKRMMLVK